MLIILFIFYSQIVETNRANVKYVIFTPNIIVKKIKNNLIAITRLDDKTIFNIIENYLKIL